MRECYLNVILPVFNEALCLRESVSRVVRMLDSIKELFEVVIVDNGSPDAPPQLASQLAEEEARVRMIRLEKAGRGAKRSWLSTRAQIVSYMDMDLSTGLTCFRALIEPLSCQESTLVGGSRLHKEAMVSRGGYRDWISSSYVLLVQYVLGGGFSGFQCGFKAADRRATDQIPPCVLNDSWFFDTELLFVGNRLEFQVSEVPVGRREDRDSWGKILPTVVKDLLGGCRLRWGSIGK